MVILYIWLAGMSPLLPQLAASWTRWASLLRPSRYPRKLRYSFSAHYQCERTYRIFGLSMRRVSRIRETNVQYIHCVCMAILSVCQQLVLVTRTPKSDSSVASEYNKIDLCNKIDLTNDHLLARVRRLEIRLGKGAGDLEQVCETLPHRSRLQYPMSCFLNVFAPLRFLGAYPQQSRGS